MISIHKFLNILTISANYTANMMMALGNGRAETELNSRIIYITFATTKRSMGINYKNAFQ